MTAGYDRRRFIQTGGGLLLLLPLAQFCNNGAEKEPAKKKAPQAVRHSGKKRKRPVAASTVSNRGWYLNTKNKKIHFFDRRGYTPSLEYLRDAKEFQAFVKHLEPWDPKQLNRSVFDKQVSKKNKDWITEQAALAMAASGNHADAAEVIRRRIEKRPLNFRLWDLLSILALRSGNESLRATQQQLVSSHTGKAMPKLNERLVRYGSADWQEKMRTKEMNWDNQKI